MAFLAKDLSVIGYANGFTLWHYTTADTSTEVSAPGYFLVARNMLRVGDFILTNTNKDAEPGHDIFVVSRNSGTSVEVSSLGGSRRD